MSRTEQPTRRRLQRAIETGNLAFSQSFVLAVSLAILLGLLPAALRLAWRTWEAWLHAALVGRPEQPGHLAAASVRAVTFCLAPVAVAAAIATAAQTGGALAWRRRSARPLDASGPGPGERFGAALRGGVVAVAVGSTGLALWYHAIPKLLFGMGDAHATLELAGVLAQNLSWCLWGVCATGAIIDVALVRSAWLRRLRMTRAEVRAEAKETAVGPETRERRRASYADYLEQVDAARRARLVVTDGGLLAVALRYDPERDSAPAILRIEHGTLTQSWVSLARARGVRIAEAPEVARQLSACRVGAPIAEALYDPVARLMR